MAHRRQERQPEERLPVPGAAEARTALPMPRRAGVLTAASATQAPAAVGFECMQVEETARWEVAARGLEVVAGAMAAAGADLAQVA